MVESLIAVFLYSKLDFNVWFIILKKGMSFKFRK